MVVPPPLCAAITPMPASAIAKAAYWCGAMRSRLPSSGRNTDKPMVKNTCIWTTSEASPGEICPFIATNNRPNWMPPMAKP